MLETDTKKITRTWREMLKTVLAKSKQLTSLQQSMIKKGGQKILVACLNTNGLTKAKHKQIIVIKIYFRQLGVTSIIHYLLPLSFMLRYAKQRYPLN